MTSRNDITGDAIKTKGASGAYRDGWDRIFGRKPEPVEVKPEPVEVKKAAPTAETLLRQEWLSYCQSNQAKFTTPDERGNLVPTFEEWRKMVGR